MMTGREHRTSPEPTRQAVLTTLSGMKAYGGVKAAWGGASNKPDLLSAFECSGWKILI